MPVQAVEHGGTVGGSVLGIKQVIQVTLIGYEAAVGEGVERLEPVHGELIAVPALLAAAFVDVTGIQVHANLAEPGHLYVCTQTGHGFKQTIRTTYVDQVGDVDFLHRAEGEIFAGHGIDGDTRCELDEQVVLVVLVVVTVLEDVEDVDVTVQIEDTRAATKLHFEVGIVVTTFRFAVGQLIDGVHHVELEPLVVVLVDVAAVIGSKGRSGGCSQQTGSDQSLGKFGHFIGLLCVS